MRLLCASLLAIGCGNDIGHATAPDAGGPPGSPAIAVTSPHAGAAFYPTASVPIAWTATDDDSPDLTCDVAAVADGNRIAIATAMTAISGHASATTWTPGSAAPSPAYRVQVTCADANGLAGAGLSAAFTVSPPPATVSYAAQVQPIWTASCNSNACHDAMVPQAGLDLTPAASYAALVGRPSGDCPSTLLVKPGAPDESYLVHKLIGSDGVACFIGTRMPKSAPALTAAQLQLVRDWIYNGAPNN